MGLTGWFVTEHAAHPEGIYVVSFVLDVGGKIQSAFLPFFHQLPIPGRWQPCRTVGRNPVVALVAQRIERRFPKPGAAGPTPAMGTMPC